MQAVIDGLTRIFESLGIPPVLGALALGFIAGMVVATGHAVTANASSGSPAIGAGRPVVVPGDGGLLVNGRPITIAPQQLSTVEMFIAQDRMIDAIKTLRNATSLGLKDSRLIVEAMRDEQKGRAAA